MPTTEKPMMDKATLPELVKKANLGELKIKGKEATVKTADGTELKGTFIDPLSKGNPFLHGKSKLATAIKEALPELFPKPTRKGKAKPTAEAEPPSKTPTDPKMWNEWFMRVSDSPGKLEATKDDVLKALNEGADKALKTLESRAKKKLENQIRESKVSIQELTEILEKLKAEAE